MKATTRFSLERHAGPYESWPLRTRLIADGGPTRVRVAGYSLLHQFAVEDGYLLVTDRDCPFEEETVLTLLSPESRVLSARTVQPLPAHPPGANRRAPSRRMVRRRLPDAHHAPKMGYPVAASADWT